jgi:hypothetical protein
MIGYFSVKKCFLKKFLNKKEKISSLRDKTLACSN